jgi:hypothetical protein
MLDARHYQKDREGAKGVFVDNARECPGGEVWDASGGYHEAIEGYGIAVTVARPCVDPHGPAGQRSGLGSSTCDRLLTYSLSWLGPPRSASGRFVTLTDCLHQPPARDCMNACDGL